MSRRRILLGAALVAPVTVALPAAALPPPSPDAALLADCARWHELAAIVNDPNHPDRHKDAQDLAEWPEWVTVESRIEAAVPATAAGMTAMARVALAEGGADPEGWNDCTELRVAHQLLLSLAGRA